MRALARVAKIVIAFFKADRRRTPTQSDFSPQAVKNAAPASVTPSVYLPRAKTPRSTSTTRTTTTIQTIRLTARSIPSVASIPAS